MSLANWTSVSHVIMADCCTCLHGDGRAEILDNPAMSRQWVRLRQAGAVLTLQSKAWPTCRPLAVSDSARYWVDKRDLPDSPVRITPWLEDIDALARAERLLLLTAPSK